MIEYRRLKKSESYSYHLLVSDAYKGGKPDPKAVVHPRDLKIIRGVFDKGELKSALAIRDYRILVGGKRIRMGGIAGVGTFSKSRKKGYAAALLTRCIEEMRTLGYAVSILFPFSYKFYREFGWELAGQHAVHSIVNRTHLPRYPEAVLVRPICASDAGRIASCYRRYAAQYNCMISRTAHDWERLFMRWKKDRVAIYPIEKGPKIIGYFVIRKSDDRRTATVAEFAAHDHIAAKAMIGFLAKLPKNVGEIVINAPDKPSIWQHLNEPCGAMSQKPLCQFRIIDLVKALTLRGYPRGAKGTIIFGLAENVALWNGGIWKLTVKHGKATVRPTRQEPEFVIDQRSFAQLYLGYHSLWDLSAAGLAYVKKRRAFDEADAIFGNQRQYILDHF